ncbi:MAG: hypothetical protein IJU47_06745 [Verrucomicrobia bacterium]|nr:hypothetical protein [Verrucomicrobiota bacterium]
MDITFNCPKCDQELVVDDSYAGEQIECPECSSQIIVPSESNVSAVESAQPAESSAPADGSSTPAAGGVINAMASSAAAREKKTFTVPVHDGPVKQEKLIQKPQTPLNAAAKKWQKGVAVRTIRRIDCMEVGKDHFDEKVTEFINTVGYERILNIQSIAYTVQDLATKALMTDFGVLITYRIPEE